MLSLEEISDRLELQHLLISYSEAIDRREKLLVYRGIASLGLYLIVAQDQREVTVHFRDTAGTWQTHQAQGLDTVAIDCLGNHELSLEAIYQDVLPA